MTQAESPMIQSSTSSDWNEAGTAFHATLAVGATLICRCLVLSIVHA
jgi:hypothetical protein